MPDDTKSKIDALPWDDIVDIAKDYGGKIRGFDSATLNLAIDDENKPQIIESAWKSLKKTNPGASYQQAVTLADLMVKFAKIVSEENKRK